MPTTAKDSRPLKDLCQTPAYALEPLLMTTILGMSNKTTVWEPASGEGLLVNAIRMAGMQCFGTDIETGEDFLTCAFPYSFDAIITNPPFSKKIDFLRRCIETKKPWALLMESNTVSLKSFQELIIPLDPEIGIVWFSPRINFKMPHKKWEGSSHFPVAWFTWNFGFSGNRFVPIPHWSKQYRSASEI